jgi:hypothetical protein
LDALTLDDWMVSPDQSKFKGADAPALTPEKRRRFLPTTTTG